MTNILKIAQVGEDILKTPAQQVLPQRFNSTELNDFIEDLLATMLAANGIGIAAPQVFDPRSIMIIASRPNPRYPDAPDMQPEVLVNPQITGLSKNTVWEWEGCLSVPGLRGRIERADWVDVSYFSAEGEAKQVHYEGFLARIFLHEYDHLIGKTWLNHITDPCNIMANDVWLEKFVTN